MRNLTIPSQARNNLGIPDIIDIVDQLPVNPNYSWSKLCGRRDPSKLTTIVLHHDACPKKDSLHRTDLEHATVIANNHIRSKKHHQNGDPGFPYHGWVRNGQAYLTNPLLDFTYGVGSNNGYTIHLCVSGDYQNFDQLTDPDRKALLGLIMAVKSVLPITIIKGHGEITPTNCPGYDVVRIKRDVQELEMELEYQNSDLAITANAVEVRARVEDLYNKLSGQHRAAAIMKLNQIHEDMKNRGIIA